mgnify:CR=1 FL=1
MRREFAVAEPPHDPRWLIAILAGMSMLGGWILLAFGTNRHVMQLPYMASTATIFVVLFFVIGRVARRRAVALDGGTLDVLATFHRRRIPMQEIDLEKARVIDLAEHTEWRPLWKTNGFAMPGFSAGWFRSRNWTRLFCLVTDRQRVLLLPVRTGGALLLSLERPAELLDAMRATDDGAGARR